MSEVKHSPGPWEIKPDPTEYSLKAISYQHEYDPNEFCSVWVAREMTEANAKLIAAAPELIEALQDCRDWYESNFQRLNPDTPICFSKALSAIKKATA